MENLLHAVVIVVILGFLIVFFLLMVNRLLKKVFKVEEGKPTDPDTQRALDMSEMWNGLNRPFM